MNSQVSRRFAVKSSIFGVLTASIPNIAYASTIRLPEPADNNDPVLFHRYPSIDDDIVQSVVGASHFDFDKVKRLVDKRIELARATWDWGFGDWESALGAASHVGRRDMALYLISKGARPNIFTFAMLGYEQAVKSLISAHPGIQRSIGPHGFTLLHHAQVGLRSKTPSDQQRAQSERLIDYLEKLGDADPRPVNMPMTEEEKKKYLGDYKYGDGEKQGFSVRLNMRNMLALGKLGSFGGALLQRAPNEFLYNGISSVRITFEVVDEHVISLTVKEPDLVLKAKRI